MGDHRIERAKERYGLELTTDQLHELERRVSVSNRVKKQEDGGVHVLDWHGVPVIVGVIEREAPIITTFLPPDVLTKKNRKTWREPRPKMKRKPKYRQIHG